jgi:hypothetical protein
LTGAEISAKYVPPTDQQKRSLSRKRCRLPFTYWALSVGIADFQFDKTAAFRALLPKQAFLVFQIFAAQAFFQSFSYLLSLHSNTIAWINRSTKYGLQLPGPKTADKTASATRPFNNFQGLVAFCRQ